MADENKQPDIFDDDWVVTYDENGVVWLEGINDPSRRIPLEHGFRLNLLPPKMPPLTCSLCEKPLEPVFAVFPRANQKSALRFVFSSSYGEFIDMVTESVEGLMCKECASTMIQAMPKIGQLLRDTL